MERPSYQMPPNGNSSHGGGPPGNGWVALYERLTRLESHAYNLDQRIVMISGDNRRLMEEMRRIVERQERRDERTESKIQAVKDAHQRVLMKVLWGLVSLVGVAMFQWVWSQMTTVGTIR